MNIARLALTSLSVGEHVSVVYEGKEYTNMQMDRAARKLGNALKKLGVKRGARVILQMPNSPEVFQSFQAIWKIGAIAVPINYQVGVLDTSYIYQDSGAQVIITSQEYMDKVKQAKLSSPEIQNIIVLSEEALDGALSYEKILQDSPDDLEIVETDDDEIATIVYTAGTTGKPKGVMQTHYALYYTAMKAQETNNYAMDAVNIAMLPLCHSYGISVMNTTNLRTHGKTVILRQFNLEKLFSAIEKYKVTNMAAVPTMYIYMLNYPDYKKFDLSSVEHFICGSAPLSIDTWRQFKEKFGGEIAEGWGLTEACASNSVNPIYGLKKVGSIGKPITGMEMKIFDNNGKELPIGKEGELVLKGPMVMKGYWKQPEATAEVIKNGWLYTGDIGYQDEDGYFFITDRKKDIIIKGGENISPRAIEEVLYTHPGVAEAACIGIPDNVYGEDIRAFVVLKAGQNTSSSEIMQYCQEKLKKFFRPKEVIILKEMPKSLVGKILKKELRKI